jgi:hypothetical protein
MKQKQSILNQSNTDESLSPFFELRKNEPESLRVPDGYFDSLSPRIVDGINLSKKKSLLKAKLPAIRKPVIWAPVLATTLVAVLLIFVIPSKKQPTVQPVDEWTQLNMAYDASYAEEALLVEGHIIETDLANTDLNSIADGVVGSNEPTAEEISKYLKEHEMDSDILIAN